MHRFFGTVSNEKTASLSEEEARHLTKVLRLGIGDSIAVFDGQGREWLARVARTSATEVLADLVEPHPSAAESEARVTLAVGLLKGDEMDAVVRDATALGVTAIVPFVSTRAVVPAAARQERAVERWTRIAIVSAKQCGRSVVPIVSRAEPFADVLLARSAELRIVCAEPQTGGGSMSFPAHADRAALFIGPEGGWTREELALATAAGAHLVTLGPRTLRASLAPVVALSALWTEWGWTAASTRDRRP